MEPNTTLPKEPAIRIYTAILNQTGTAPPIATILHNTLNGTVVWTRTNTGEYKATLSNAFTVGKTVAIIGGNSGDVVSATGGGYTIATLTSINVITIETGDGADTTDDVLFNKPIEIRVYK